jgi:type II secretory pathway predicted ATPase ExeA
MYESFYGLGRRPFSATADADCYYPSTTIETARQTLFRCIDRGEGVALLIGPSGSGKTLLLQVLAEQFRSRFGVALLGNGRFNSRRELLQAILYEMRLPYRDLHEGELRLALIDHLSGTRRSESAAGGEREGMLLLIDEAHTLPLKLLEEIRLITNLVRGGQPRVRLVLAGAPAPEERFTSPKLDAFNQRVSARCYLQAFSRSETCEYVKAQIEWAGGKPEALFSPAALDAVYLATQGVPRLINQVCDHALLLGCTAGSAMLDKPAIEEAWADLQQLPMPWNRDPGTTTATNAPVNAEVIEFGVLDDVPSQEVDISVSLPAATDDENRQAANEASLSAEEQIEIEVAEIQADAFGDETLAAWPTFGEEGVLQFEPGPSLAGFGSQDPLYRLSEVQRQLAGIDSDVPSPSESEVIMCADIDGDSSWNPFNERFAHEELVIDPFAMTAADALANRPLVECEEGRKLGRLLKPLSNAAPKLSLAAPDLHDAADDVDGWPAVLELDGASGDDAASGPAIEWQPAGAGANGNYDRASDAQQFGAIKFETTPENSAPSIADECAGGEPELIVIEDELPAVHQATVVRRGQYRQLFSNLRRG